MCPRGRPRGQGRSRGLHFCLTGLSLFLDMNKELLKLRMLVAVQDQKISFICKSSVYFSAPPLSASAPLLRLLWYNSTLNTTIITNLFKK